MNLSSYQALVAGCRAQAREIIEEKVDTRLLVSGFGEPQVLGRYEITMTIEGSEGVHTLGFDLEAVDSSGQIVMGRDRCGVCVSCGHMAAQASLRPCSKCGRLVHVTGPCCGEADGAFVCAAHAPGLVSRLVSSFFSLLLSLLRLVLSPFIKFQRG